MAQITQHIRRPVAPRGGNQFYKDRGPRPQSTFCGAAITAMDLGARDPGHSWEANGNEYRACAECLEHRKLNQ